MLCEWACDVVQRMQKHSRASVCRPDVCVGVSRYIERGGVEKHNVKP